MMQKKRITQRINKQEEKTLTVAPAPLVQVQQHLLLEFIFAVRDVDLFVLEH
jgi:hypothetical protein